ncbi:hypothetical protein Ahy_A10g049704 [Arachis hypogaea]|uniref:DUF659 domain-containing protein n=1 Tax=Arachis hypogaea TaxID=3818 RepID=A0A445B7Q5_ARAHY|nr:hypothetical protein Ahy_A10g049704 [Arachis hypogaea]
MLDGVAGIGPNYKGPFHDKLRVHLLADLKRECQIIKETGCNLMVDGWIDQRILINFLVYYSKGLCLVKSVDVLNVAKNASSLSLVFGVTDNAANYVAADISSMSHISNLASHASKITVFVYNRPVFLSWLRQRTTSKEIFRLSVTRFSAVFITLKNIFEQKADLQALVVDAHFM